MAMAAAELTTVATVTVAVVVHGFIVVIWTPISLGTPSPPCV
jgi:hypothetical protein